MKLAPQIARQFREAYLDGTWIAGTNLKDQLSAVSWQQATAQMGSLNTIAALAFHLHYYVAGLVRVLQGGPLDIRDKYSFELPPITSQNDWEALLEQFWQDAETFARLVERMPDEQLQADFVEAKYGNYLRNILGTIEHAYYHLGQIVLIRKLLEARPG